MEINTMQWHSVANELYRLMETKKNLEIIITKKNELLKELSGNNSHIDKEYAFIKEYRRGTIQYASIPELKQIDLEAYRGNQVACWKLIKIEKNIVSKT